MSMNVVNDESNCYLLFEFFKKMDELVAGKVMIEKGSYHYIILLFLKFFAENIQCLKLNMRIRHVNFVLQKQQYLDSHLSR